MSSVIMDTYGLDDNEGRAKIGPALRDRWWEKYSPWAAVPVRGKGLHQIFTINGLGLTPNLMRCLGTT